MQFYRDLARLSNSKDLNSECDAMPRIEDSCGKGFAALKLEGVANGGEIRPFFSRQILLDFGLRGPV
jgi:hypothetical protein